MGLHINSNADASNQLSETFSDIRNVQVFLEQYPEITKTLSVVDIMKTFFPYMKDEMLDSKLFQSNVFYYEIEEILGSNELQIIREVYNPKTRRGRIIVWVKDMGSIKLNGILSDLDDFLENHIKNEINFLPTGRPILVERMYQLLMGSLAKSCGFAVIAIFLLVFIYFKSIRLALISMIPNLFPIVFVLAFMSIAKISLKPTTILVFSIIFGLVIDDTIHLLSWTDYKLKEGFGIKDSVIDACQNCGRSIIITSILFCTGFSIFLLSNFKVLIYMGLLINVALFAALIADLFVTPACLSLLRNPSKKNLKNRGKEKCKLSEKYLE